MRGTPQMRTRGGVSELPGVHLLRVIRHARGGAAHRERGQDRNPLARGDNFVNALSQASPNGGPAAGGIGRYRK